MSQTVYSVSQINSFVKDLLDQSELMNSISVRGEISNFKAAVSGHLYFTIKDVESSLKCVMFRMAAGRIRFRPQNGMQIIAVGRITAYPRDGVFQLYCDFLMPDGIGDLHAAFEALKQKLMQEGLFDKEFKKKIPVFPKVIGVITSEKGAAVHDIIRIVSMRYPLCRVILIPAAVQGAESAEELVKAIELANLLKIADLLIVGRGGGSFEDLFSFSDESVARAIFKSEIPVISAVGHEPDVSISDFVADIVAATPSNAAELATPDRNALYAEIMQLSDALLRRMRTILEDKRQQTDTADHILSAFEPQKRIQTQREFLQLQSSLLYRQMEQRLSSKRQTSDRLRDTLYALSPMKILQRGYGMVSLNGAVVDSVKKLRQGENIKISFHDGCAEAQITELEASIYE